MNGRGNIARDALHWWRTLQPDPDRRNPADRAGDRATLARLRRAAESAEAMAEEATLALWTSIGGGDQPRLPRVATIAHVLAHVREPGERVMRRVGRAKADDPDSASLKPMRFRRLLAARDEADLMREMRRLVLLADRKLDPGELATALLFWSDDTRARWAFDYFAAGAAAPHAEHNPAPPAAADANLSIDETAR